MSHRLRLFGLIAVLIGGLVFLERATLAAAQTLQSPPTLIGAESLSTPITTPILPGKSLLESLTQPVGPGKVSIASFMTGGAASNKEAKRDLPDIFANFVRYLRDNPSPVIDELKSFSARKDLVVAAAKNGDTTAFNTLLSALVLDQFSSQSLLDSLKLLDTVTAKAVRSDMAEARRMLSTYTGAQVTAALLAQGAVRSGLSGTNDAGTAGTGSIGLYIAKRDWRLIGLVTVASSVDTLRSGFGSFVLTPASGKGSLSTFLVDLHTPPIPLFRKGGKISPLSPALHLYVAGANSVWERQTFAPDPTDATAIDTTRSHKQSAVLGMGALLNWRIVRGRLLNVPVQISVETGYGRRYLRGDIFADSSFIRGTLQSPDSLVKKSWGAWESGFQMAIGAVTAGVQYYWIDGNNDKSFISGLTSGQLVIGIAVSGDVVSGILSQ